ncbi:hypothetical protein KFE25_008024 [Diacronema lutheri]|uniref:Tubulin epsilon and delta complex protein 1 domain-containing protein n=1 Tax=Diacronema lutheri TaxID=2081491 RepID=A0A8J5XWA7_DIALT|nr:hypothetical protein KFE25_008024 [Diacronema lutheri]
MVSLANERAPPVRHLCAALGTLGVRVAEADVFAAARGDPRAEPALLRALHDVSLLHTAGWPTRTASADVDRAWLAASSAADALLFVQAHLHACGYVRTPIYFARVGGADADAPATAAEGSSDAASRPEAPSASAAAVAAPAARGGGFARELLLALGWLLAFSGAFRIAAARRVDMPARARPTPLWPADSADAPHNAARAAGAEAEARAYVGGLRRASLGLLARAAGRPGPADEPPPTLAEAIVAAGHTVLALLGTFQLALRQALRAHLRYARLVDRAQRVGRALRLPAFAPADASAGGARGGSAMPPSWTLHELWVCTLGGTAAGGDQRAVGDGAAHAANAHGGGGGVPCPAHDGGAGADGARPSEELELERRSKTELRAVLAFLRSRAEARAHERALFRWLGALAELEMGAPPRAPSAPSAPRTSRLDDALDAQPSLASRARAEPCSAHGVGVAEPRALPRAAYAREMSDALGAHLREAARALVPYARACEPGERHADPDARGVRARLAPVRAAIDGWPDAWQRARASCADWPAPEAPLIEGAHAERLAERETQRPGQEGAALLRVPCVLASGERPSCGAPAALSHAEAFAEAQTVAAGEHARELADTLAHERAQWREELRLLLEPLSSELVCWGF